jgi:four helix bundle protein
LKSPDAERLSRRSQEPAPHAFVLATYRFTATFPKHETYGVVSQMRRAAVSILANIAEGFTKRGRVDKARF